MKLWVRKSTVCFQFKVALGASGLRLHFYGGYNRGLWVASFPVAFWSVSFPFSGCVCNSFLMLGVCFTVSDGFRPFRSQSVALSMMKRTGKTSTLKHSLTALNHF